MKKLLFSICFLLSLAAFGQHNKIPGRTVRQTLEDYRAIFKYNLGIPIYYDTTVANIADNLGIDSVGFIIYTSSDNGLYFRGRNAFNTKYWIKANVSGEVGTGTVTSVNMTVPTGLSVTGGPITSSGTLTVTFAAGYSIPTTASQSNWNTAFSWGNHATAGYLTSIPNLQQVTTAGNSTNDTIFVQGAKISNGSDGLYFGANAGQGGSGATPNIGIGNTALYNNTGTYATAVGSNAGQDNTATQMTAMGFVAGQGNSGTESSMFGSGAGTNNTGSRLTALGTSAGNSNTGNNSTFVGHGAGASNTYNSIIALGKSAQAIADSQFALSPDTRSVYVPNMPTGVGYIWTDVNGDGIYTSQPVPAASIAWGGITGTITTQTDLTSYLSTNYSAIGHTHTYASLTSKPTTLSGFGITDAVPAARILTINGVALDLSANRSWTITTTGLDSIHLRGTLYVSKNGNDGTGLRNRLDKPFATIQAAITAATKYDLVVVYPGTYVEPFIFKDSVNLHFYDGAIVDVSDGAYDGIWVMSDNNVRIGVTITGDGIFKRSTGYANTRGVIELEGNGSFLHIQGKMISNTDVNNTAIKIEDAKIDIKVDSIVSASNGIETAGGNTPDTVKVWHQGTIYIPKTSGGACVYTNGLTYFWSQNSRYVAHGNDVTISARDNSQIYGKNNYYWSDGYNGLDLMGGNSEFHNCHIESQNVGAPNDRNAILFAASGNLILDNCTMISHSSAAYSIRYTGTGKVYLTTPCKSNKIIQATTNIRFGKTNLLIDSLYRGFVRADSNYHAIPTELAYTTPLDRYIIKYNATTGQANWVPDSTGSSGITAADTLAMLAPYQTAINNNTASILLKAPLASPTFTGTPSLPTGTTGVTQSAGNSTTALATTNFVTTADNLKANIASPTFTGTVSGITATMVGAPSLTTANSYTAGMKQTFTGDATNAGFRMGGVTASPSSLAAGDMWYRSDLGTYHYYDGVGLTVRTFVNLAGAQTLTNKTLTSPVISNATVSKAAVYDGSGVLGSSATSATELGYVSGVTSAIQTQINTNATAIATKAANTALAYQALGSNTKYQTVGMAMSNITTTAVLNDGQTRWVAIYVSETTTLTGVKWHQGAQGNYTADQYNGVGLYSYSGGTLTLVASSTNDGNIWKATASTTSTKDFSSTYSASPGIYYVCMLYNSSAEVTAPAFGIATGMTTGVSSTDFTNSAKLAAVLNAQNSLPSPQVMSGLTISTTNAWVALY